jgi:hypothetical protein
MKNKECDSIFDRSNKIQVNSKEQQIFQNNKLIDVNMNNKNVIDLDENANLKANLDSRNNINSMDQNKKKKKKKRKNKNIINSNLKMNNESINSYKINNALDSIDNNYEENNNENILNNNDSLTYFNLNSSTSVHIKDVSNVLIDKTSIAITKKNNNINKECNENKFLQNKRERLDIATYNDFVNKFNIAKKTIMQKIQQLNNIIKEKQQKIKLGNSVLNEKDFKKIIGFNCKSEFINLGNLYYILEDYKNKIHNPEFISKYRRYLCHKENCAYGDFCYFAHNIKDLILPESNRSLGKKTNKKGICKYYFYNKFCIIKDCPYIHIDA